jgi:hypothetical protein
MPCVRARCTVEVAAAPCSPIWPMQLASKEDYTHTFVPARACSSQWLTLTANRRYLQAPTWSKCFPAADRAKMLTRARSVFSRVAIECVLTLQQANIVVPRRKMQANCSWCFENSTLILDRESTKWICQACLGACDRCMASGCNVRNTNQLLFSSLFTCFALGHGALRGHLARPCVTCAGLWAKTSQSRASVFEHNRDVAGVRFELRYRILLSASLMPALRPPS